MDKVIWRTYLTENIHCSSLELENKSLQPMSKSKALSGEKTFLNKSSTLLILFEADGISIDSNTLP